MRTSITAKCLVYGDSTALLALAPAAQWQRQLWVAQIPGMAQARAGISLATLREWWWEARPGVRQNWAACRGPINAMILSLQRIQWIMEDPFCVTTDQDDKLWLPGMAPKLFEELLKEGSRRQMERDMAKKIAEEEL